MDLTENEEVIDQVVVRVWRIARIWWVIFLIPLISFLPYYETYPLVSVPLTIFILWSTTYLIRQRWRLTLTNRQIVARQLLPRPLTIISRIHYFPLNKIEGLTVGPRAFRTILLVGVYIATNLGVTILKSGLSLRSQELDFDLPDTVEALILFLRGITFFPFLTTVANWIEDATLDLFQGSADTLISLGIGLIIIGIVTVLLTIPRRYHLQIRVRHGADFKLTAGIPRKFWEECYQQLYKDEITEAPSEYRKWRFPWLQGEKAETSADLEEVIYLNRFISIFAILVGSSRLYRAITGQAFSTGNDVFLWAIVALTDIFIAVVAVVFSKKKNEMVVTNRRIIYAQEMPDISGAFGRRLYLMSDIGRDDVAGFRIHRLRGISYRYFILTIAITIITVGFWQDLVVSGNLIGTIFVRSIFIFLILLSGNFIFQTYLEFNLKTTGNEIWNMRHQLSNPLTMMRELVGNDENIVLTTILSNRLEEKEVVDMIQILRATELGLQPKLFEDSKYFGNKYRAVERVSREVDIEDLLLREETIKYESNVSRGVPRRKLNLLIASFVMLGTGSSMFLPLILTEDIELIDPNLVGLLVIVPIILLLIMIVGLWARYYSLFRARIMFTDKRAFFTDIKRPPLLLYLLGITEQSTIEETLQNQIHSTYSSRQFSQQQYWRDFLYHGSRFLLYSVILGVSVAILETVFTGSSQLLDQFPVVELLLPIVVFFVFIGALSMTWHIGNWYIAAIRSFPRRVVHTQGVGSHFIVPFANKKKADQISQTVWEGIITEEST